MAFKMKKFSGFKSVGENIKKVSKKVATKVATDKIKNQQDRDWETLRKKADKSRFTYGQLI